MGEPISYTDRGFAIFADLTDTYEASVCVAESSHAEYEAVWVFIDGGEVVGNEGAAHLNIEQAKVVRDAITSWLEHAARMEGREQV